MISQQCEAIGISIFMAGDYDDAIKISRQYCDEIGLCVTVTPAIYIYTGGQEDGFIVGLINYPRFPTTLDALEKVARELASRLRIGLGQQSFTIQTGADATWYSWRDEVTYD